MSNIAHTTYAINVKNPVQPIMDFGIADVGTLINLGSKLWNFITDNEAQSTTSETPATAIPEGTTVDQIAFPTGQQQTTEYQISFPGYLYGYYAWVKFSLEYQCGGTYDGKGAYLADLRPTFSDYVSWGQKFDVSMTLQTPTYSSTGVAQLSGTISATDSDLTSATKSCTFAVYGNCQTPTVSC
eukprot:JP446517.1.p1 GENE.JP446517.1~~JP446517.1.p1  ORF type:complete len:184 (+),score=67.93 JP446517.1:191-742(+)